jgi:tRNA-binding EMAP/Myf-like protein
MFVTEDTRELARMVVITEINPIPKADRLEVAVVDGGWECVVKKGLYAVGETALYFEIDSAIPMNHPILANFDKSYLHKVLDEETNQEYAVIKTVKLRGVRSQGLLLSKDNYENSDQLWLRGVASLPAGSNVTNLLDVKKWVSAAEAKLYRANERENKRDVSSLRQWWNNLRLKVHGDVIVDGLLPFPVDLKKSEERRIQNSATLYNKIREANLSVELSYKLNGESATFYTDTKTGNIGAAQRNFALRLEDVPYSLGQSVRVFTADWMRFIARRLAGGRCSMPHWKRAYYADSEPLVKFFRENDIANRLKELNDINYSQYGNRIAIQGEMVGPDFNGDAEKCPVNRFFVYRVYRNNNETLLPADARIIANALSLDYIPLVEGNAKLPATMKELLAKADGPGYFDKTIQREGMVAKCSATGESFKIISNKWLEMIDAQQAAKKETA